jgi:cellulose biosynthesis protein BcsE
VGTARAALLEWSRDHRGALLVLGRAQVDGRALAPVLAGAGFTRVATVRGGSEVRLSAARWGEELGSPRSWCAMPGHPGAWSESGGVCASADGETGESVEPEDPLAVHALGDALPEGSEAPEHWILHSGMDDLITSCEHAGEGSVALSCGGSGDFPELARAVHRLRRAHPADFPIVVRESAVRLRNSERRILRMLGVSGIAAREEGFPRVLDLLAGGRGEARAHSIDGTGLERLLRAVAPGSETGYLPAPQFCEAVRSAVASAAGTPVGHVLAQLPLLRHVRHLDALLACFVRRSGDLVTADAEGLVVLLHGCDQRDAIPTLEQLFEIPVSELFGLIRLHWDEHSQRREVDALARAWEGAPTDYSTALELLHARPVSSAPRGAPPERGSTLVRVPASLLPTRILSLRAGPQGPAPSNP